MTVNIVYDSAWKAKKIIFQLISRSQWNEFERDECRSSEWNGKGENSSGEVRYQNTHAQCNLVFSVLSFETAEGARLSARI